MAGATMFAVGERIDGQFVVLERHEGGMGVVLVVLDELTQHKFAVKTLRPELRENVAALDRFRQEARTWLSIRRHEHLVYAAIYREIEGVPLLFLEYVDGLSLAELLARERVLWLPQALTYGLQICAAMLYLHQLRTPAGEQGIIHRDLKPSNVLLGRHGELKVTDFGLAKVHGDLRALAEGRRGLGTYPYMPPEQVLDAASADQRSDIYSFGATLYHMLAGRPPVQGRDSAAVVAAVLHRPPQPPRELNPLVPEVLEKVVLRCLAKQREERYASFAEVRAALEECREAVAQAVARQASWVCRQCGYRTPRRHGSCPVCAGGLVSTEEGRPAPPVEQPPAARPADLLQRALEHRRAGRFDQALLLLRQAVELAPDRPDLVRTLDETARLAARHRVRTSQRSYNWPMEGGNVNRTSYTPEVVAPPLRLAWATPVAEWITAPVVISDGLVFAGGYVDRPGRYGRFCALRLADGEVVWELGAHQELVAAPCVLQGRLLYLPVGNRLVAVEASSGQPRWELDLQASIFASPLVVGNLLIAASTAGLLFAFSCQSGQEVWRFAAQGPFLAGAAACEDLQMLWIGGADGRVYALDLITGTPRWSYATGGEIQAAPTYLRGSVLASSLDHRLYCLQAGDGRKRWEFEADAEIHTSAAGWENTVVIGTRAGCAFGLALDSGQRKWRFTAQDWVDATPVLSGRTVYLGSHDGFLYALERESGIMLWRYHLGCPLAAPPAISAGALVIAGRDGKVYCFRPHA
jgi:outer membrane protein assembly factor BamB